MHKALFDIVFPAGPGAALSIVIFHRVVPTPDPLFPGETDVRRFDDVCSWLRRWFNVLPLDEAVRRLSEGRLPARALSITFDDGYADNHDHAMPVLQRHGLSATFFIATGFLDGGCMWNDRVIEAVRQMQAPVLRLPDTLGVGATEFAVHDWAAKRQTIDRLLAALKYRAPAVRDADVAHVVRAAGSRTPTDLMMTSAQVQGLLRGGMSLGGHTVDHPILARLDEAEALDQMARSRRTLESLLQQPVSLFAYPNGRPGDDYTARDVALVRRAGYAAAVCTAPGVSRRDTDTFQLPRFTPWDQARWRFGLRLALNVRTPVRSCPADLPGAAPVATGA